MVLLYFDGFNSYSANSIFTQNWTVTGNNAGYSFPSGRYGGNCVSANGYLNSGNPYNAVFKYTFPSSIATTSVGVAIKHTPLAATSNTTPIVALSYNSNAALSVYIYYNPYGNFYYPVIVNGSNTTLITGKAIANYDPTTWHYYELEAQAGTTTGLARFYVDTVLVASVSNVNTTYSSNLFYNSATVQSGTWDTTQRNTMIDDFYVNNTTTRTGEINVVTLRPNSDASVAWTATGGGTHYNQINGTTYSTNPATNIGTAVNSTELFNVADLPSSGTSVLGTIKALKTNTLAYKGAFGKANIFQTMRIDGNPINNASMVPFESPANSTLLPSDIYENNPFTNSSWSATAINNMQTGVVMNAIQNVKLSIVNGSILNSSSSTRITSGVNAPTVSGDTLIFSGNQQIRYTDSNDFHVTAPYSMEMEFYTSSLSNSPMLFNIGQGFGIGYPEFVVQLFNTGQIVLYTASANNAAAQVSRTLVPPGTVQLNTWYRIGFMVYTYSGSLRIRGYFNGAQMFDDSLVQPWDSPNGMAIIGDNAGYPTVFLNGGVRNFSVAKSLFWPINIPNYNNIVYSIINGQITGAPATKPGDTPPTVSGDSLIFNGSQRVRYNDSSSFRAEPPYSVEFEFKTTTVSATQILFNIGGDLITNFPELMININSSAGLMFFTNSNNTSPNQSAVFSANGTLVTNTWYKVGLMIYNNGGNRARGYVNDSQVFDIPINLPWDSTTGSSIGSSLGTDGYFSGSIRNLRVGEAIFWPI